MQHMLILLSGSSWVRPDRCPEQELPDAVLHLQQSVCSLHQSCSDSRLATSDLVRVSLFDLV